jgi:ATP-dependent helicase/nuclease subunit A
MPRRLKPLKMLGVEQAQAADPKVHATLSASAGTGKTHVLTARVLRLLLGGVAPETILCLTFTKAGAAEMANRIGARLASWVRMPDADLAADLKALGEDIGPGAREKARRLFARVLDAPGGLRIQTIHSFAQALLAAFPAEAGITPGFRPIEGRAERELARRTLAELVADAEAGRNAQLIADIQALSMRLGEKGAEDYLMTAARHGEGLAEFVLPEAIEPALRREVGLPDGDVDALVAEWCADGAFDCALLRAIAGANRNWATDTGLGHAATIDQWLALDPAGRAAGLDRLAAVFLTGKGEPRVVKSGQTKAYPDYQFASNAMVKAVGDLLMTLRKDALVKVQAAGLRAGWAFADAYAAAKRAAGVADFDDLIRWTRKLLDQPGMGDWVRYKLDRRTDHILVDEAQDTNDDQWSIVKALSDEFFSGSSEAEDRWRTLFMVGDFKQAIYSFQGTDPASFEEMRRRALGMAADLAEAARGDLDLFVRDFRDLSIAASFRSSPAILSLVDAVIAEVGHEAMGLPAHPPRHEAHHQDRFGRVEHWPAFELETDENLNDNNEEGWIDDADRAHAGRIAQMVLALLHDGAVLASTGRPVTPGDILILVRSRGELASLIVARLFTAGVPVAGIDRLHLHRPLAVRDLLAAVGFAVQPLDDLNLANLLVSPLIGFSQQRLYDVAFRRPSRLWAALQDAKGQPDVDAALDVLGDLLKMADYTTPAQFLETILSGPIQGRRKLLGRLGHEARDPIEELLGAALEFERNETASLDRFLSWFGSGEVEIKRDPAAPGDTVRVMTVHGAKGLEAPIVILADATADPDRLGPTTPPLAVSIGGREVPVVRPRKQELCPPFVDIVDEQARKDRAEHLRLLYVALTRAEERLIVTGVRKRGDNELSWHAVVGRAMTGLPVERDEASGALVLELGSSSSARRKGSPAQVVPLAKPAWLATPAPDEERPPRPLAPSALAEDRTAYPPPAPGEIDSARRGTLLHSLFERLPGVEPSLRKSVAQKWLAGAAPAASEAARVQIAEAACALIDDPAHADLFARGSLAEAPIAASLPDGRVVAGTVDRLLVGPDRIRLVDFKTGGRVPAGEADVPAAHRLQMEAYRMALRVIFPGRAIDADLLYTAGPKIIRLSG